MYFYGVKNLYKHVSLLLVVLFLAPKAGKASHLTGGEISYECLGGGQYQVTLTIFRDDYYANPNAVLDNPAILTIFNNDNNTFLKTENMYLGTDIILPNNTNSCIQNPPSDVRIEKGVYTKVISLPNNSRGYTIVYQRCCRNNSIINLQTNFGQQEQGSTVAITIPPNSLCNSSPVFKNQPPLFLCANSKLEFDMSATDVNGDQLRYSLCAPLQGLSPNNPLIGSGGLNRAEYPPYDSVNYAYGYNSQYPLGMGSSIYINPISGELTAIPHTLGKFVIGVCVQEIRGGVVLSSSIRDFQVNVEPCNIPSSVPIVVTDNSASTAIKVNDTTYSNCQGVTVRFDNGVNQTGNTYFWDFGDPKKADDTSTLKNPTYVYADTGVYFVTLIINKGKPCTDTSRIKVIYYPGLKANFTYVPGCQNDVIQFKDSSVSIYNDVNKWQWVLSAGDTSYLKDPTKTYTNPGNYNVQLMASTAKGCVAKAAKTITVYPKPTANFTSNYLCYKHSATFTDASILSQGTISNYTWNFGDGTSDTTKNTAHVYSIFSDSIAVKHVVVSALGCKDSIIKKIKMDDTVKINYTTAPINLCEKAAVTFVNTSTGGNPTAFQWVINNGTPINGNTTTASFPSGGIYPIKLIATNRCGNDTLSNTIKINSNPTVNLGNTITVCNKSTKTLNAAGSFDSLRWNTYETTASIVLDGNKSPIIVAVYKNGCVGKDTVLVKKQIITPNFSTNYLCLNKPIVFNNNSTINSGTLVQYDWKYGDGHSDNNIQNPTHTFTPFNNYTIQLIATSDIGCKDTIAKTLLMDTVLHVDFTTAEAVSCQRKEVDFKNLTTGGINNQYSWKIENNTVAAKDAAHTFLGIGIYPVKLVVTNRCYADSLTKNIQIKPRPNVYLGRDTVLCKNEKTVLTVNPALYDSIRWINGTTNATQQVDGTINPFKVKVYLSGCMAEDTIAITAPKFNLDFSNIFICYNKPITFNNNSSVSFGNISNYNWDFGDGQTINGVKNPQHTYSSFGPKTIQLITTGNVGNCKDTLKKVIAMDDSIAFKINPVPTTICFGKTVLYTNQSTGGNNTTYTWLLNNKNTQAGNTATYTHTIVGANILQLSANNRCGIDSVKYPFTVLPLPKINLGKDSIIMCPGELKTIGIHQTADSIFWSTGERDKDSITINGLSSPIKVQVYNKGCLATDSIFISTNCDIFIPTAFSPNHDGHNDWFNMMKNSVKSYTLKVYDRWGELVFQTNDLNNNWDGTYKGVPCPTDNYIFIVNGIRYNDEPFYLKGTVTLLR